MGVDASNRSTPSFERLVKVFQPTLVGIAALAGLFALDLILRFPPSLSLAYAVPIALATRRGGLRNGLPMLVASTVIGTFSLILGGLVGRTGLIMNAAIEALALTGVMLFAERSRAEIRSTIHRSTMDDLTGARTRQATIDLGERAVNRAIRAGESIVVAIIDVDKFKQLNDRHGHALGDTVLVDLVRTLRSVLGDNDVIGRTGGDEFLIVMPQRSVEEAERLFRLASNKFQDCTLVKGYASSFSYGFATPGRDGIRWDVLLDAADQDMYRRKGHKAHTLALQSVI